MNIYKALVSITQDAHGAQTWNLIEREKYNTYKATTKTKYKPNIEQKLYGWTTMFWEFP